MLLKMKNIILLLILSIVIQAHIMGQGYDVGASYDTLGLNKRSQLAEQAINDLKNGVLVVRLKTGNNKLSALHRVANSQEVGAATQEKFKEKIAAYEQELRQENEWLVKALEENYTFSETVFLLDTSAYQLKNQVRSGIFLNNKMEVDPGISLEGRPFLVVYYGQALSSRKSGIDGVVVLDSNLNELYDPFPFFTGMTGIKRLLAKFLNKKGDAEFLAEIVTKFQKRLDEYYELVN